jgi:hypothetical protein
MAYLTVRGKTLRGCVRVTPRARDHHEVCGMPRDHHEVEAPLLGGLR